MKPETILTTMTNATPDATKSSATDAGDAGPPANRSMKVDVGLSWSDLRPELIGHIARFLPMGTPDMMRLLLCCKCFGPRVAAVVRKMYLTGDDYYLCYYTGIHKFIRRSSDGIIAVHNTSATRSRARECIGYWMQHNEKKWKKRCLGKNLERNVHSIALTPDQVKSLTLRLEVTTGIGIELYSGIFLDMKASLHDNSTLDDESLDVLTKLAKNCPDIFLISVGNKDVDECMLKKVGGQERLPPVTDELLAEERLHSFVESAALNDDGKISLRLMRSIDALFACPQLFLEYDLVHVLRYMIEEEIIEPSTKIKSVDEVGDRQERSLLFHALSQQCSSGNSFRYLLSLPGTDVNAASLSEETARERRYENIIHSCTSTSSRGSFHNPYPCDTVPPSFLEAVLAHPSVNVDARNSMGLTALLEACMFANAEAPDHNFVKARTAKVQMLLKAGADPRVANSRGVPPLRFLDYSIVSTEYASRSDERKERTAILKEVRDAIIGRVNELNERDQNQ